MRTRYAAEGIAWLAINSAGADAPGAALKENADFAARNNFKGPVLFDPKGMVGAAYEAQTTPQMYLINEKGVLLYRGALDNAPHGEVIEKGQPKVNYVDLALKDLKAGKSATTPETKPYGCPVRAAQK
jgi:hypothetical protein